MLSAGQIENYRAIASQIRFFETSRLLTEAATQQIERICRRYADGQISLDLFLSELDNTAHLIHAEAQYSTCPSGARLRFIQHLLRRVDLCLAGGQAAGLGDSEAVGKQWGSDRGTEAVPTRDLAWPTLPWPFPYF